MNLGLYIFTISALNVLSIIILIALLFPKLIRLHKKDSAFSWIAIITISSLAFYILMFVFPHFHFLYCDEWYIINMAHKAINLDFLNLNPPSFIPSSILYIPGFIVFGLSDNAAFLVTIIIGILSSFLFFLFVKLLTKDTWAAIYATILSAFSIAQIQWSLATYDTMTGLFFIMIAFYFFQVYLKTSSNKALFISLLSVIYASHIRIETILILVFIIPAYFYQHKKLNLRTIEPWLIFSTMLASILPRTLFYLRDFSGDINSRMHFSNIMPNLLDSAKLIYLHPAYVALSILVVYSMYTFYKKKNYNAIFLAISAATIILFYYLLNKDYLDSHRFIFSQKVFFIFIAYGIVSLFARFKKQKKFIYFIIGLSLLILSINHDLTVANDWKSNENINIFIFNSRLPDYLKDRLPQNCTLLTITPERYSATTKLRIANIDDYDNIKGCKIFIDDITSTYTPKFEKKITDFLKDKNLTTIGYVDNTNITIPDKNLIINYSIYRLEG